jgi:hypothetical protein
MRGRAANGKVPLPSSQEIVSLLSDQAALLLKEAEMQYSRDQ